jgi:hypothetical protein
MHRLTSLVVVTEVQHEQGEELLATQLAEQDLKFELVRVLDQPLTQASGRTRSPTSREVNARSNSVADKTQTLMATHVILAGNVPLWTYRPDLRIGRMRRRAMVAKGLVLYPLHNPVAALRNPIWAREIGSDLYHLRQIIEAEDWSLEAPNTCVWCTAVPTEPQWDPNGVLYCESHWRTR